MCEVRLFLFVLGFVKITTGFMYPCVLPLTNYVIPCDAQKQTPSGGNSVTEPSVPNFEDDSEQSEGKSESATQTKKEQIYIPSLSVLQKADGGNVYELYQNNFPIKENEKHRNLEKLPEKMPEAENHDISKKSLYIRNTRSYTKSPLDKDIFYTRNTRSPEPEWFLRNTKDASNKPEEKRNYYLRNTRDNSKTSPEKKSYYLRNTRDNSDPSLRKREYYLRNTRDSSENFMDKRPFYLRNTRDWFMRNTRGGELMSAYDRFGRNTRNPDEMSNDKRQWYMRNTRNSENYTTKKREWFMRNTRGDAEVPPPYDWYQTIFRDIREDVPASKRGDEPSKDDGNPENVKDNTPFLNLGKRSAGCMLRCIDEGLLHPAQCHSLC